jgi:hypothetical protein
MAARNQNQASDIESSAAATQNSGNPSKSVNYMQHFLMRRDTLNPHRRRVCKFFVIFFCSEFSGNPAGLSHWVIRIWSLNYRTYYWELALLCRILIFLGNQVLQFQI